jgi:hypothetical protein
MFPTWQDLNNVVQSALISRAKEENPEAVRKFKLNLLKAKFNFEKIGMLVSFVHPEIEDLVCIGFSICNIKKHDIFDKVQTSKLTYTDFPGLSFKIATGRAIRWSQKTSLFQSPETPFVPTSISKEFENFVLRSMRYYKDKRFPVWVNLFLEKRSK